MNERPYLRRILLSITGVIVIAVSASIALAEPTTYAGITFPYGDVSFADRVTAYVAASCVDEQFTDPRAALGPPDCGGAMCYACDGCDPCAVSLGFRLSALDNRGYLILEFVDNRLVDVPGDDLFIYIIDYKSCRVEISRDGASYIFVGEVSEYPGAIDISPFVSADEEFRFVRLTDVPGDEEPSCCSGPSIDAVGAMGPLREIGESFGALQLLSVGELSIAVEQAARNILIILDTSTSMAEAFENATKIKIAKQVLTELVEVIPEGMWVGLRTFGGCERSQLLVPMEPLNKAYLQAQIHAIDTSGATPIAYTLERAKEDFAAVPDAKLILLVSDGKETCGGDPVAAARGLIAAGYDLKIHVIGFDIAQEPEAREQLTKIAEVTGGTYFDAESSEQLRIALQHSLPIRYRVYNQQGEEVFIGVLGEAGPRLPPGVYRVVIDAFPAFVLENVAIQSDRTTTITLERSNGNYSAEVK